MSFPYLRTHVPKLLPVLICMQVLAAPETAPLKALIVDGQNNHQWRATTPVLKAILEDCGRFQVEVATSPAKGQVMDGFRPDFAKYEVVVLNYNGDSWPEATGAAFVEYVRGGGGVVVVHAADNAFGKWPEYNEIIGIGGWGGRDEKSGPFVRYRDGQVVLDDSPGRAGSHPPQHEFQVIHRQPDHPILRGLPHTWLHVADELYGRLRGPAKNLEVLATAYSDPDKRNGTGEHEPALFTVRYGQGRVFHTILGHAAKQMQCVGFIVTTQRGAEWAATGEVTLTDVPADFPTADQSSTRELALAEHPNAAQIAQQPKARKPVRSRGTQPPDKPIPLTEQATLLARQCTLHGNGAGYEPAANRDCIGNWRNVKTWVSWDIAVTSPGTFEVEVSQSMSGQAGATYEVEVAGQKLNGTVENTGDWAKFSAVKLGQVHLEKSDKLTVAFRPLTKPKTYVMNLRSVTLRRVKGDAE